MKIRRLSFVSFWVLFVALNLGVSQCTTSKKPKSPTGGHAQPDSYKQLPEGARLISILMTNDMHGAVEAGVSKDGVRSGGLAMFSGVTRAIRQGLKDQMGERAGVLVLDAGDQFQGTLLSNSNEGELMFSAMNDAGYDAAALGNHDYDFGPIGWLEDTVSSPEQDRRGVIKKLSSLARFPLLSANTFYMDSLQDPEGKPVAVANVGCKPKQEGALINWARARQPEYLKPFLIKEVAGVRVALIGIDAAKTPTSTAISNIEDLCFADEIETYVRVREELADRADLFVLILHDGNTPQERKGGAIRVAEALSPPGRAPLADAIIAGHTHTVQEDLIRGIPIIQTGSGTRSFGRLDLVWNTATRSLDRDQTRILGGISLMHENCDAKAATFCRVDLANKTVRYEGRPARLDATVVARIEEAQKVIAPISDRQLGIAAQRLYVDRIKESPLANVLTDSLRQLSGTDIAFMNTGGIREPISEGVFTYSGLFSVLPFNNRAVLVGPISVDKLLALLQQSIKTCGQYGALMQSGLKVQFEKLCKKDMPLDEQARILRVETLGGEVIFDAVQGIRMDSSRTFRVATLDYLHGGGSGYSEFKGTPLMGDIGIVREILRDHLVSEAEKNGKLTEFAGKLDGRWLEKARPDENAGGEVIN